MGLQLNKQIRSYQLIERIGKGGFGEVYRAYQPTVGREVAIKVIMPQHANRPDFIRNFETEAKMVARIEHPFIVPLFDYWREPNGAYIVMRYLRGGTLKQEMTDGAMPLVRVADILDNLCSALWTSHRNRVAHRDIKPANIMLDEDGRAYLSDFGLAITVGEDHFENLVGTWLYMPPERIQDRQQTHTVDIYSLGVMAYQMIAGEYPFDRTTMERLAQSHISQFLPPIERYRTDVPQELNMILQRATSKVPDARYEDIRVFAQDFRQIIQPIGTLEDVTLTLPTYEDVMNPYMGLRPFTEADSEYFFGRLALIDTLVNRMTEDTMLANFLALVGSSGSGKSSVIYAGLIPQLKAGIIRGSEHWYYASMTPGSRPFQNLLLALRSVAAIPVKDITDQLKADSQALNKLVPTLLGSEDSTLFLYIDQFEEVFTQVDDEELRQAFLDLLTNTIANPASHIQIIITMRADFYDKPLHYEEFGKLIQHRNEVILPLDTSELEHVITRPANRVGLEVETELVAEIISDVRSEPGALPLLQYTLTELAHHCNGTTLTLKSYHDSGGVRGTLARRADDVYKSLTTEQQNIARQIFLRLVTLGEGSEDTRRRAHFSELHAIATDNRAIEAVMNEFSQYRLLTFDRDPETREPTAEVAHEALIREWRQFRIWLDASRADLRLQRLITSEIEDWKDNEQDTSYLLRGNRLAQFEHWAESTNLIVTEDELDFIQASIVESNREKQEQEKHQQLELHLMKQSSRRLRQIVALLLIASIGGITLLGAIFIQNQQIQKERDSAISAEQFAEDAKATAETNLSAAYSSSLATIARQAYSQGDFELALAFAMKATEQDGNSTVAYNTLEEIAYGPGISQIIQGDGVRVYDVVLSKSGSVAITVSGLDYTDLLEFYLSGDERNNTTSTLLPKAPDFSAIDFGTVPSSIVRVWDTKTGLLKTEFSGHSSTVTSIGFVPAPDENDTPTLAYSASILGEVFIWDIETGNIVQTFEYLPQGHNRLSVTLGGKYMLGTSGSIVDTDEDRLVLWDVETGQIVRRYELHGNLIWDSVISGDGRYGVSAYLDHMQVAWDVETGEVIAKFEIDDEIIEPHYRIALSDDGETVVSSVGSGETYIWHFKNGVLRREEVAFSLNSVFDIALSDDGDRLLLLQPNGVFIDWDIKSEQLNDVWEERGNTLFSVDLSADGNTAIIADEDGSLFVWDLQYIAPDLAQSFDDFGANMQAAFLPFDVNKGQDILVFDGTYETGELVHSTLSIWNVETGNLVDTWDTPHQLFPKRVVVDDSGQYALTFTSPNPRSPSSRHLQQKVIVWDLANQSAILELEPEMFIHDALFVHDDESIKILSNWQGGIVLWDMVSGEQIRTFDISSEVIRVSVTDDLQYVFGTTSDGYLVQWDFASGNEVTKYELGQNSDVLEVVSDHSWVVTGYNVRDIAIWDYETQITQKPYMVMRGHLEKPTSLAFVEVVMPDGEETDNFLMMISSSLDGTVIYWDMDVFETIGNLQYNSSILDISIDSLDVYHLIVPDIGALDVSYVILPDEDILGFIEENRIVSEITLQDCVQYNVEELCRTTGVINRDT